jgi:hypothetical protein
MPQIIESIKAHYDTVEVPFGRVYCWHQAHVVLECDCGEKITFTGTSAVTTCQCGADYGALVHDIHYREERQRDDDIHPWHYDAQSQAGQHLRDEAAYAEASPWRYNDVTSGLIGDEEERWKKASAQHQLRSSVSIP